ncbi:MAG: outer membrane beta-barrel domain-containing protein [Oligoflexia bacterium]|nr:outer membrane beta-barrel domain-containing protein [Oligoflexia bacterium]
MYSKHLKSQLIICFIIYIITISSTLIIEDLISANIASAGEGSLYNFKWLDQDKKVYVLQNRKFRKKSSLYIMGGGGFSPDETYLTSYNLQARAGYFFTEDFGLELLYGKNFGSENNDAKSVKSAGAIPFYRDVQSYYGGLLLWSPFYAKMNTFNTIIYFDIIFGLGASKITEENNKNHLDSGNTLTSKTIENHTAFLWNIASKIYLTQTYAFRIDLLSQNYQARRSLKSASESDQIWYRHYDLTLSFCVTF